ncbi:MAG TPA: VanZ family protein [Gemmatimonadales bacterium]|nr:VanZ family protein [Gemmatimonadales bacterium]
MQRRIAIVLAVLSAAAILYLTLRPGTGLVAEGWSYDLTSGDAALAELIQNLILFIPLGISLTLAGVRSRSVVLIGALLSFSVEFAQRSIPGRDPSVGDIITNTVSTAIGTLLVATARSWLWAPPGRSAWQARATAVIAVLAWSGTGLMLQQSFPPPPYTNVPTPDLPHFGHYKGQVLSVRQVRRGLEVVAVAPPRAPGQTSPLIAMLDTQQTRVVMLSVIGTDLTLRYAMPALRYTLEQPDLRLRGALKSVAPGDTFVAATWHDSTDICLRLNALERCHLGYTIGDGWKLIYFPEGQPAWTLGLINTLWMMGCVIGVGFWAARSRGGEHGAGGIALTIVILGLLMVPLVTGLNATPVTEWLGTLAGLGAGYLAARRYGAGTIR